MSAMRAAGRCSGLLWTGNFLCGDTQEHQQSNAFILKLGGSGQESWSGSPQELSTILDKQGLRTLQV